MKYSLQLFLIFLGLATFQPTFPAGLPVIPKPNRIELLSGFFDLTKPVKIKSEGISNASTRRFEDYLKSAGFKISNEQEAVIELCIDRKNPLLTNPEAYLLKIEPSKITITAAKENGLFYAIQTLLQLVSEYGANKQIPALNITDCPRFPYRGMHLDVSRHFFPLVFIKKQLDMMAYYKLNRFHWHLTDGPGWRLQIKKYPLLTEVAAWRTHKTWKDWWASKRQYVNRTDSSAYGGFYTQDEAREIVRYAAARHITVIPEIEMPGHSEEVLAVYPQLSCSGIPYKNSEFCPGKEATFTFLENVLTEVMDVFPSEYIHIGGDEANKEPWKTCPNCQKRLKDEKLKNVDELQSYLIRRIEKFVTKHGRKIIGWDEILEGGLAPNATVMSWRGENGAIEAARSGHNAIMTPGAFCYFDFYQSEPVNQAEAIGGYLPLEKVYSYNPVPAGLTPTEAKHITGVQANLWTEYIATPERAEYQLYPRLLALAEVAWTKPENKSWNDFNRRVNDAIPYLQSKGYHPFTLSGEVTFVQDVDSIKKCILVTLSTEKYGKEIRYTPDGALPGPASAFYSEPIIVTDSALITAQVFDQGEVVGKPVAKRFDYHRAIGRKVIYNIPINPYYPAAGNSSLTDGRTGGLTHWDGRWQGFMTDGMDVTIDMQQIMPVRKISARFMQNAGTWIYFPAEVVISISEDNKTFTEIARIANPYEVKTAGTIFHDFSWKGNALGRFIRYQGLPNDIKGGWVFLDEIVVW